LRRFMKLTLLQGSKEQLFQSTLIKCSHSDMVIIRGCMIASKINSLDEVMCLGCKSIMEQIVEEIREKFSELG
jgi:hypothetical protein